MFEFLSNAFWIWSKTKGLLHQSIKSTLVQILFWDLDERIPKLLTDVKKIRSNFYFCTDLTQHFVFLSYTYLRSWITALIWCALKSASRLTCSRLIDLPVWGWIQLETLRMFSKILENISWWRWWYVVMSFWQVAKQSWVVKITGRFCKMVLVKFCPHWTYTYKEQQNFTRRVGIF